MTETTELPTKSNPHRKRHSILFRIGRALLILILVAIAAILFIGFVVLDGQYDVSREITIQAPPAAVHQQVGDLREWPNWLPFTKHDPSVKTTIEQPTGVGARQHWTSDNGTGKLEFTSSDPEKGIVFSMLFDEKWASQGTITYARAGDTTRVTWRMTGQNQDFLGKWMALAMPAMVGPMFEEGLTDLKKKVEAK